MKFVLGVFILISFKACCSQAIRQNNVLEIISLLSKLENTIPNSNLSFLFQKYYDVYPSFKELEKINSICSKQIISIIGGINRKELWALKCKSKYAYIHSNP